MPALKNMNRADSATWQPPNLRNRSVDSSSSYFETFAHVGRHGGYLSNPRLRNLASQKVHKLKVIDMHVELFPNICCLDTYRFNSADSDRVVQTNLQIMLAFIAKCVEDELATYQGIDPAPDMYLTGSPYPEHAIYARRHPHNLVVSAVARGTAASIRSCELELHAVSGSACVELSRRGLQRTDCVVPGIAMAGRNVQFFGTYLLRDTFPVMVALSPEMCLTGTTREQMEIAAWCVRLADFAVQTLDMTRNAQPLLSLPQASVTLNMAKYFPKPLSDDCLAIHIDSRKYVEHDYTTACVRLQRVMEVYQRLYHAALAHEGDLDLIQFPEGVVTIPCHDYPGREGERALLIRRCKEAGFRRADYDNRPVMLFPRLATTDGWTSNPPPVHLQALYLHELRRAVQLLNRAKVAHLDLHPANILWRCVDSQDPKLELRVIDFEHAQLFDTVIPNRFVSLCSHRYPFTDKQREAAYRIESAAEEAAQRAGERVQALATRERPTQRIVACAYHNDFYLDLVTRWVQSGGGEDR
jgi:hypothetical protein